MNIPSINWEAFNIKTRQKRPKVDPYGPMMPYVSGWCWLNHHQSPPLGSAVVPVSSQAMSRMSSFSSQCRDAGRRLTRPGWSSHVARWKARLVSPTWYDWGCSHWMPLIHWNQFVDIHWPRIAAILVVQVRFRGLCHHHWFHPTEHGCLPCLERCGPPNHAALFSFRTVSIHLQTTTAIDMSWLSHFWAGVASFGQKMCLVLCLSGPEIE